MGGRHDFGHNGKAGFLFGHQQQPQALIMKPLEGVWRGTGLEGAAAKEIGAAGFYRLGDGYDLFLTFHGAGAGNDLELFSAHKHQALCSGDLHHGIFRMELPVGQLVWLLDALYGFHDVVGGDIVLVKAGGIAHQSDDVALFAYNGMGVNISDCFQVGNQFFDFLGVGVFLQYNNHSYNLLLTVYDPVFRSPNRHSALPARKPKA